MVKNGMVGPNSSKLRDPLLAEPTLQLMGLTVAKSQARTYNKII